MSMNPNAVIAGTGFYVPPNRLTNEDMKRFVDTSDEWIRSRTGIKTRHMIDPNSPIMNVDMCEQASRQALEKADIQASDLDMIIVATMSGDYRLPATSCLLQDRLKASNAWAFDISAACAGSLFALRIANQFFKDTNHENILVVGSEYLSSAIDWTDRNTCVLFGDAAGAAVLKRSKQPGSGFIDFEFHTDGSLWQNIWMPHGGKIQMKGQETFKFATRALAQAVARILEKNHLKSSDVNQVVAHQANLRIIEAVSSRVDIPLERFMINIDRYANTSSASLLITYDEAISQNRIKSGDLILMMAIGAGFVWGVALYRV